MAEAFPLCWPVAYPRAASRQIARFDRVTFAVARDRLFAELERLRARKVILSSNVPLKQDGAPRADFERRTIRDPGVAVYFEWKGKPRVLACDKWTTLEDNLHALELTIAAMRGLERWGASAILERAFTGLTALPAPIQWWDVLDVHADTPLEACEAVYRDRIKLAHPDRGGSENKAAELNWAIGRAREERRSA